MGQWAAAGGRGPRTIRSGPDVPRSLLPPPEGPGTAPERKVPGGGGGGCSTRQTSRVTPRARTPLFYPAPRQASWSVGGRSGGEAGLLDCRLSLRERACIVAFRSAKGRACIRSLTPFRGAKGDNPTALEGESKGANAVK